MDIAAKLARAEVEHREDRLAEAEKIYRSVLLFDPECADACYGLGTIYLQREDYQSSYEYLKQASELQQDVPEFMVNLAMTLEKLNRSFEAKEAYVKAIDLAPNDAEILIRAANRLLALGFERDVYNLLLHNNINDPRIDLLKARSASAVGDWAGATKIFHSIVAQNPNNSEIWKKLSSAAARCRDYPTAISAFQKYLSLSPDNSDDLLAYADLLLIARDTDKLKRFISQIEQRLPDTAQSHLLQAKYYRLFGDYQTALEHLQSSIKLAPESGDTWQLKLELVPEALRMDLATSCEEIAARGNSKSRDQILLQLTAGRAYEGCGEYEKAFRCFRRGNEIHKQDLKSKNSVYDQQEVENTIDRISHLFATPIDNSPASAPSPIFVLGMPRSGTTLVERIICEHEGIESGGENEAMEFIAAQYYRDLENGSQARPQKLDKKSWLQMQAEYWRRSNCQPSRLTDKMPHNFRHVGLITSIFPSSPIIYVRRDPRDVCLSIFSRMFPDGHRYACDLQWLAHFYHQSTKLMAYWQKTFPDKILQVDYEQLIADPEATSRGLAAFCGLHWNPDCLGFYKKHTPSFTFSELQVRQPINQEGLGRWRHYEMELAPLLTSLRIFGEID